jgi:predicted metal-binding membrane protein
MVNVESRRAAAPPVVLAATLGVAAACWAATAWLMHGMDMAGAGSGLGFGLCCVGSTIGLMAMLVALDVMSLFWMSVVAVLTCAQKLLPAHAAIDVPLALALIGFGFVIVLAPSLVPGLMPPAM